MQAKDIFDLDTALLGIKQKSRPAYKKCWNEFTSFFRGGQDFETRVPAEAEMIEYFKYLRDELKRKSSTIWTTYSTLNSVTKGRYSFDLNNYKRLKSVLKTLIRRKKPVYSPMKIWKNFSVLICRTSTGWSEEPSVLLRTLVVCD